MANGKNRESLTALLVLSRSLRGAWTSTGSAASALRFGAMATEVVAVAVAVPKSESVAEGSRARWSLKGQAAAG
jgi:hypothetical protein